MFIMIFFWAALIVVIVYFFRRSRGYTGSFGGGSSEDSPLDILKKRYAKGEIDKEEFERMKKDLGY